MKLLTTLMVGAAMVGAMAMTSCSDDKDLPNVNINTTFGDDSPVRDGVVYVVQGDNLDITSITCTNNEPGKGAFIANISFYVDDVQMAYSVVSPFSVQFNTTNWPVGNHILRMVCTVGAVDKEIAFAVIEYPIKVVAAATDIPAAGSDDTPQTTQVPTITPTE